MPIPYILYLAKAVQKWAAFLVSTDNRRAHGDHRVHGLICHLRMEQMGDSGVDGIPDSTGYAHTRAHP